MLVAKASKHLEADEGRDTTPWEDPIGKLLVGGGNSNIFYFHPYWGEDEPILTHIFQMGWNHQPGRLHHTTPQPPRKFLSSESESTPEK